MLLRALQDQRHRANRRRDTLENVTIRYSLRRADVWRAYSRQWRKGWTLKAAQVVIAGSVFYVTLTCLAGGKPVQPDQIVSAALVTAAVVAFLPLYPLLMFKPQERVLTIAPRGISTTIGRHSAEVEWRRIESISSEGDRIYIVGKSQKAFAVPDYAFGSADDREKFLHLATQWFEATRR